MIYKIKLVCYTIGITTKKKAIVNWKKKTESGKKNNGANYPLRESGNILRTIICGSR